MRVSECAFDAFKFSLSQQGGKMCPILAVLEKNSGEYENKPKIREPKAVSTTIVVLWLRPCDDWQWYRDRYQKPSFDE